MALINNKLSQCQQVQRIKQMHINSQRLEFIERNNAGMFCVAVYMFSANSML